MTHSRIIYDLRFSSLIGPFQEVALWIEEDAITLFGLNTSKAPALLPGGGDVSSGTNNDSLFVNIK